MSDYENAPATRRLATNCIVCSRPLLDAASVEAGIGPDCAKRHGYNRPAGDADRAAANGIVREIACSRDGAATVTACVALRGLGYEQLAATIESRWAAVEIKIEGDRIVIKSEYRPEAVQALRGIKGRQWDGEAKLNTFPVASKRAVWDALRAGYAGCFAVGPRGAFIVQ